MNDDLILELLEQIITGILTTVDSTNWLDDAAGQQSLQQIYTMLDQFGVAVADVLPLEIIQEYFGGVDEATNALIEAGDDIAPTLAITDEGLIAAPFQKVIHTNAVEQIVDDTMSDMSAAIATAKLSAAGAIGTTLATVKSDIAKGMIKGDPWKVTQQAVMESFLKDGMTSFRVEDKNGVVRHLPLRFYAMTVVRTKRREASVQGSMNRFIDAGQDLTIITGNGDSCEICARFNGMVVSMTGKTEGFPAIGENGIKLGPYHPNCRCGHRVFMMKFATDEEIKAAKARNKKYKPTGDPRTAEEKAAYEEEQRKRRVANAEAKQFARWQGVLGAEAPATIGAFRTMKRKNSPKFQELQSAFLSATHTKMASPEQMKAADDAAIAKAKKEADAAKAKAAKAKADQEAAAAKAKEAKAAAKRAKEEAEQDARIAASIKAAKQAQEDAEMDARIAETLKRAAEEEAERKAAKAAAASVPKMDIADNVTMDPQTVRVDPADYAYPDTEEMRQVGDANYDAFNRSQRDAYHGYVATSKSFGINKFLYSGEYQKYEDDESLFDDISDVDMDRYDAIGDLTRLIQKHQLPVKMKTSRNVGSDFMESVMKSVGLDLPDYAPGYNDAEYLDTLKAALGGVRYTNKGFTSASYNPDMNVMSGMPVRMTLLSEAGQKGLVTQNHFESEVVFDKDTEFEFTDFGIGQDAETKRGFLDVIARIVK